MLVVAWILAALQVCGGYGGLYKTDIKANLSAWKTTITWQPQSVILALSLLCAVHETVGFPCDKYQWYIHETVAARDMDSGKIRGICIVGLSDLHDIG